MVFYNFLLGGQRELSTNDKIVYSYLIYKSLALIDGVYSSEGELDANNIMFGIDESGSIPINDIGNSVISKDLCVSRKTVINSVAHLRNYGYISENRIAIRYDDISKGFFRLISGEGLSGDLMVFYSYLYNKSRKYHEIDTYSSRLATIFGKSKLCISNYLHRLSDLRLTGRLPNGKLIVFESY